MTLPDSHPIAVLRGFASAHSVFRATFRGYRWTPGKEEVVEDKVFLGYQVLDGTLEKWLLEPRDFEIGLCSQVYTAAGYRHIPMVDFAAPVTKCPRLSLYKPLPPSLVGGHYYQTTRSFHGYGTTLIGPEHEFVEFMARCLLLNQPWGGTAVLRPLVDPLWVGWQLLRGFAVLRWTANTKRWDQFPSQIPCPILGSK